MIAEAISEVPHITEVKTMLNDDTRRKLLELKLPEMAKAIDVQDADIHCVNMSFDERMKMIDDRVHQEKHNESVKRAIRAAKFRVDADIHSIYHIDRGFTKEETLAVASCKFVEEHKSVVIHGPTGSGKTYLGCAIGKEACKRRLRTRYIRMPDLLMEMDELSVVSTGKLKQLKKYSSYDLLILDEWLFEDLTKDELQYTFELIERRYDNKATIFCTQYPKKDWHNRLAGGIHADSIMDRIVHNAIWLYTGTKNMRELTSKGYIG